MTRPRIFVAAVVGPAAALAALLLAAPGHAQLNTPTVPTVPGVDITSSILPPVTVAPRLPNVIVTALPVIATSGGAGTSGGTSGTAGGRSTGGGATGAAGAAGGSVTSGLDWTATAGPESSPKAGGSTAKESAGLSALAVVMLALIVAGTALVGSRKSSD